MERKRTLLAIIGLSLFLCLFCPTATIERTAAIESQPDANSVDQDQSLTVHFIDVGTGDLPLIPSSLDLGVIED